MVLPNVNTGSPHVAAHNAERAEIDRIDDAVVLLDGVAVKKTLFDDKGDLVVGSGNDSVSRKAIGLKGDILEADSNDSTGLRWQARPELARNYLLDPGFNTGVNWGLNQVTATFNSTEVAPAEPGGRVARLVTSGLLQSSGLFTVLEDVADPGTPVRYTVWVRTTVTRRLYLVGSDGPSDEKVCPAGQWVKLSATGVVNNGRQVVPVVYYSPGQNYPAGEVFYFSNALLELEHKQSTSWFGGDTAGCYWTGSPGASASVKANYGAEDVLQVKRTPDLGRNITLSLPDNQETGTANPTSVIGSIRLVDGPPGFVGAYRRLTFNDGAGSTVHQGRYASLEPNTDYAVSFWVRSSVALTVNPTCFEFPGPSAASLISGLGDVAIPVNIWRQVFATFRSKSDAESVWLQARINAAGFPAGGTYDVTGMTLVKSSVPVRPIEGSQPGSVWEGVPGTSASRAVMPTLEQLLIPGLLGQGSPEGKVPARVGTRYVDENATTGAIEWIKTSGAGPTGWKVVYGDTGRRYVSLQSGWVGAGVLQRIGSIVYFSAEPIQNGGVTGDKLFDLIAGFRPVVLVSAAIVSGPGPGNVNARGTGNGSYVDTALRDGFYLTMSWTTAEPWPTTLPGTTA